MKNNAVEIYTAVPKMHNCAQAVAAGAGREDLVEAFKVCGGGKAPGNTCGALHAAMLIAGEAHAEELRRRFVSELGSEKCAELKRQLFVPCATCVATAARLAEELEK